VPRGGAGGVGGGGGGGAPPPEDGAPHQRCEPRRRRIGSDCWSSEKVRVRVAVVEPGFVLS
jgi:hypothetical protein